MHFYKKLYISEAIKKNSLKIKWKLKTGRPQPTIYVIALAKNNDLLEIYHSAILKQSYYKKKENTPFIVGIADSYSSSVELVVNIIEDVWADTESYDVKKYFGK